MKKYTFSDKEVGDFYNENFINVMYDGDKEQGKAFKKANPNQIPGYPTHLFFDVTTKSFVHKAVGLVRGKGFIGEGRMVVEGTGMDVLQKEYDKGTRDYPFFYKYASALFNSGKRDEARVIVYDYYAKNETKDSLFNKDKFDFYSNFISVDVTCKLFDDIVSNRAKLIQKGIAKKGTIDKFIIKAYDFTTREIITPIIDKEKMTSTLPVATEKYNMLKRQYGFLKDLLELKPAEIMLIIYDKIVAGDYNGAFKLITSAAEFNMRTFEGYYISNQFVHIAFNTKDRKLIKSMAVYLEAIQAKESRQLDTYNICEPIALLYTKLGDKKKQLKYETMNAEILAANKILLEQRSGGKSPKRQK